MFRIFVCMLAILTCCHISLLAQQSRELVQQEISIPQIKKTIDSLNNLADTLCLHKDPRGKELALRALYLSKKIRYDIGIGDACHCLGLTKFRRDNDSAALYFKQAKYAYDNEFPGYEKMVMTLNNLSRTYDEIQEFDSSLFYARAATNFMRLHKTGAGIVDKWSMYSYGATANAHTGQGRYDSANYYLLKAVLLAEKTGNEKMLAVYFKGLSGIQSQLGNDQKAVEYGKKAVMYSRDDCRGHSIALASLAGMYSRIRDYENADKMADSSISTGRQCNVWNSIGRNYATLGNSRLQYKDYHAALQYFNTGIRMSLQHKNSRATLGMLHRRLGEVYQVMDSLPQAKDHFVQALEMADGDHEMEASVFLALSKLLFKQGDAVSAYKYVEQYNQFRDLVYTNEKVKTISELNTRYETEKANQQLLLLSKEKTLQAALLNEQRQLLEKERVVKQRQQLEIDNYALQSEKREQVLRIQQLDIENSRIRQSEQQAMLTNSSVKLQMEQSQKALAMDEAKQKRNWVIFLATAFLVSAIISFLLFNRYRLIKQMQNTEALIKQRERISRELHDEIGATLSGISMYSHLAKEQLNDVVNPGMIQSLNIIQQNAGEMVNKLNDIVWLTNPGNDNLQQLMQRLEDYAIQMAAAKNIIVKSNFNELARNILLPAEDRQNIYLIFKEGINNAVKYSKASMLVMTSKQIGSQFIITLSDNGIGFNYAEIKKGNGLENMKHRAKEINAKFSIDTSDKGTSLTISI